MPSLLSETREPLPALSAVQALGPLLVKAAQHEYDQWDEACVEEYAGGGICHLIADQFARVLDANGVSAASVSSSHEQHVYVLVQTQDGVISLDLPWSLYEYGAGYNWTKRANVLFDPSDLQWTCVSTDPSQFETLCQD